MLFNLTLKSVLFSCILFFSITNAVAKDVYVKGYYKKDGSYVRSHYRAPPNKYRHENYGPSRNSSELMRPKLRDNDYDGTPNYLDRDDDNDGVPDDYDRIQY